VRDHRGHLEIDARRGRGAEIEGGIEWWSFRSPRSSPPTRAQRAALPCAQRDHGCQEEALGGQDRIARGGGLELLALTPPPERKEGKIVGEGAAAVPELVRLLREEAKVL